jgi:hypothetical protein
VTLASRIPAVRHAATDAARPSRACRPDAAGQPQGHIGVSEAITLAWSASTDNVAVTGYNTYRGTSQTGQTSQTTATYGGLSCGTAYQFGVDAYDAAGNKSARADMPGHDRSVRRQQGALPRVGAREPPLRAAGRDADDEVKESARAAQIHALSASLPEGYESVVGERGYRFSSGEKQRIGIARTILRNPPPVCSTRRPPRSTRRRSAPRRRRSSGSRRAAQ